MSLSCGAKYIGVYWNLRFICDLVLEIWDFEISIEECEMTIEFLSTTGY